MQMKAQTVVNSSIVRPLQYAPQNPVFEHGVYQEYVTGLMGPNSPRRSGGCTVGYSRPTSRGPTYVRAL
eukprot:scaffold88344_cov29-Attheya_sp.AAC.5